MDRILHLIIFLLFLLTNLCLNFCRTSELGSLRCFSVLWLCDCYFLFIYAHHYSE
ncbi:unnamed protein product [Moneuplotes crassus]|uniref:Uncharacterized protein n=1 Tax=Euplotes crassus TaxID=5936 RepID=A0AAD1Y045_EUPCR|nr:unnamed protein product [Moneuplotes crassus]